jgi:hypothetical protein
MLSKPDYIYWTFLLYFSIQSSLAVSLLLAHKHKLRRFTLLFCAHALYNTQSIVEKENRATVAHSLTDKHTCISIYRQKRARLPVHKTPTWKKKSICLWQNQIHIVNELKILFTQNKKAVLQNVKRSTL